MRIDDSLTRIALLLVLALIVPACQKRAETAAPAESAAGSETAAASSTSPVPETAAPAQPTAAPVAADTMSPDNAARYGTSENTMTIAPMKSEASCKIGSTLDAAGNVAAEKTTFSSGDPIYYTISKPTAVPGEKLEVIVIDPMGQEYKSYGRTMGNEKTFTFPIRGIPSGSWRINGGWQHEVCEIRFVINP